MTTIGARRTDVRFVVRSAAPRWLFAPTARRTMEAHIDGPMNEIEVQEVETDTGVVQIDSLRLDEEETARRAGRFYEGFDARVAHEADVLRSLKADLVLGDIPPLACAAAHRAGVPGVAVGNFTWDWIYSIYPAFARVAPHAIPVIQRAYATATLALRLPLHGGFEPMAGVTRDIPFIARRSTRDRTETRRALGLRDDRPVVLVSFGGYGANLPLDALGRSDRFTLIPPVHAPQAGTPPAGFRYEDLVAAADVVVSKPGYGIVSECVANGPALLYTSRGRFAEYDVFVAEMPRLLRCQYLSQEDLFAGRWADAIDALVAQPEPRERPRLDGADVAARNILALVHESVG